MTFFIKLENGQPASNAIAEENFRQLFPDTVFAVPFTASAVEPLGYGIYDFSSQPEPGKYQKVVEIAPVRNEFGIWKQTWQVVDMNADEQIAADLRQAGNMRAQRNLMIARTDWTQLPDAPLSAESKTAWATYRQALRDITSQAGFPWTVNWPTQPE